jgi:hypothetical protein
MCVCTQVYELQSQVQDAHAQLMHQHHQLEMAASVEQQKQQVLADAARAREEGVLVGQLFGFIGGVFALWPHRVYMLVSLPHGSKHCNAPKCVCGIHLLSCVCLQQLTTSVGIAIATAATAGAVPSDGTVMARSAASRRHGPAASTNGTPSAMVATPHGHTTRPHHLTCHGSRIVLWAVPSRRSHSPGPPPPTDAWG